MKKHKKAQLKMGENISIMFIFILLIVVGMLFFFKVQTASMKIKQHENTELSAIQVAQKASFLPELRCSSENVPVQNCYDTLKMENIKYAITKEDSYYYDIFKYSTIYVEEVFPGNRTWLIYNSTGNKPSKLSTQIPISMYDPMTSSLGSYYFGILHVGVYS